MKNVLKEVQQERERQEAKWGQQNHADGTGPDHYFLGKGNDGPRTYEFLRNRATWITDMNAQNGRITYSDIFLEEVFEALSETDQDKLREELIQCAAVAVAWVEKIDRDRLRPPRRSEYLPGDLVSMHVTGTFEEDFNGSHGVIIYPEDNNGGWQVSSASGSIRCTSEELTMITRREDR